MRAPKIPQSSFRSPVNEILGTEASVRVLRELSIAEAPLARAELAERAGLSAPGVSGAVARLQRTGVVEAVGGGTRQSVQMSTEHPLSLPIRALFLAEASRVAAVQDALRATMDTVSPRPRAAWLESLDTRAPDAPLRLGVLARADELAAVEAQILPDVREIERRYHVAIELRGTTSADLAAAPESADAELRRAIPVYGPHPLDLAGSDGEPRGRSGKARHQDRERVSALRAAWIAVQLNRDPSLPRRARQWLVHRTHAASERESGDLAEWIQLLDGPIPRIQQVLLGSGDWPDRMRQNNPFLPVLSDRERQQMKEHVGE